MSDPEIADDTLLDQLRNALNPNVTDAQVAELAKAAFSFRTMDEELWLATLDYDAERDLAAVRRGPAHTLTFRSDTALVELEVLDRQVIGQVVPPIAGELTAEFADGVVLAVELDELGCFSLSMRGGPMRLLLVGPEGRLTTEWVTFEQSS